MVYMIDNEVDTILAQIRMKGNGSRKCKTRYRMARTIMDIKQRVLFYSEAGYQCEALPDLSIIDPRKSAGNIYGGDITGMEEARDDLIELICERDQQLKILSVVGYGGLGKTTLAKAVYDRVQQQFDCRAFVALSQNPDTKKLLLKILLSIGKAIHSSDEEKDEEQLALEIREFLHNKRCTFNSLYICMVGFID